MADQAGSTDSTDTVETGTDETIDTGTDSTDTVDKDAEVEKWKAIARKHEERAKANADAARKLQEIEDANKTEQQKLEERAAAAEAKATSTETELARLKAAVKFGLAEGDLDLLGSGTPDEIEERAEKLAARLADASAQSDADRPVNGLGRTTQSTALNGDPLYRDLTSKLGISG